MFCWDYLEKFIADLGFIEEIPLENFDLWTFLYWGYVYRKKTSFWLLIPKRVDYLVYLGLICADYFIVS
jgi:hypothetical protein